MVCTNISRGKMNEKIDTTFFYRNIIYNILNKNRMYNLRNIVKFGENKIKAYFLDGKIKIIEVK